jgi:hypothetical protein
MAAASPAVMRPSSGISAVNRAAETGPMPGMEHHNTGNEFRIDPVRRGPLE